MTYMKRICVLLLLLTFTFSLVACGGGGDEGRREWIDDKEILKRQILEAFEQKSYGGICLYSYNSLFNPSSDVSGLVKDELNALKTVLT